MSRPGAGDARPERRSVRARRSSASVPTRRATMARGSPTPSIRPATGSTCCYVKDLRTGAVSAPMAGRVDGRGRGPRRRRRSSTPRKTRSPSGPISALRQKLGGQARGDLRGEGRPVRAGREPHAQQGYILVESESATTSEVRYMPGEPAAPSRRGSSRPGSTTRSTSVEHVGRRFYIRTNDCGPHLPPGHGTGERSRPGQLDRADPEPRRTRCSRTWTRFSRPHGHDGARGRAGALPGAQPRRGRPEGRELSRADLLGVSGAELSVRDPRVPFRLHVHDHADVSVRLQREDRCSARCSSASRCWAATTRTTTASERIWATASDGTKVPVSLVYRKELVRNGQRPMLLEGMGRTATRTTCSSPRTTSACSTGA